MENKPIGIRFTLKTLLVIMLVVATYFAGRNARISNLETQIENQDTRLKSQEVDLKNQEINIEAIKGRLIMQINADFERSQVSD